MIVAQDKLSPSRAPSSMSSQEDLYSTAGITLPKVSQYRPKQNIFASYFPDSDNDERPMSVTVLKPQAEVYALLRDIQNFPLFFENLEKVEESGASRANWYFRDGTSSMTVPMAMESTKKDELLVWKAEDKAGFVYTVALYLEPAQANRGTVVRMKVAYDSAVGEVVGMIEKLFGSDALLLSKKNLQRFKAFCETGHVPTTEGQSSGRAEDQDDGLEDYPNGLQPQHVKH